MPLRVLQVITNPTRRGAQLLAMDLSDALGRAGIDVRTVALGPAHDAITVDVPVLGTRRVAWSTIAALRREIARADVAVAHGGQALPVCALATVGSRKPEAVRRPADQRLTVLGVHPGAQTVRPRRTCPRGACRSAVGGSRDHPAGTIRGAR